MVKHDLSFIFVYLCTKQNKMANEMNSLLSLQSNVRQLRLLGKELGVSEQDINKCIDEALNDIKRERPNHLEQLINDDSLSNILKKHMKFLLKVWLISTAILICLLLSVYVAVSCSTKVEEHVVRTLHVHGYSIFRQVRFATLPLHDMFNITGARPLTCYCQK